MSQTETTMELEARTHLGNELTAEAVYKKCNALANNLWWTWHPEVIALFMKEARPIE